jgi:hypothetical protein
MLYTIGHVVAVVVLLVVGVLFIVFGLSAWFATWGTKEGVIQICLAYSLISLVVFWAIAIVQSLASKAAKEVVDGATTQQQYKDNPSAVLAEAAKLVDAFTKAGPAMASLGASIAALGFATYIVAQPPKDDDKTKTGTQNAPQGTTAPPARTN